MCMSDWCVFIALRRVLFGRQSLRHAHRYLVTSFAALTAADD